MNTSRFRSLIGFALLLLAPLAHAQINGSQVNHGKIGVAQGGFAPGLYKGTWSSTATYTYAQRVQYGGELWESLTNANSGNTPTAGANWADAGPVGTANFPDIADNTSTGSVSLQTLHSKGPVVDVYHPDFGGVDNTSYVAIGATPTQAQITTGTNNLAHIMAGLDYACTQFGSNDAAKAIFPHGHVLIYGTLIPHCIMPISGDGSDATVLQEIHPTANLWTIRQNGANNYYPSTPYVANDTVAYYGYVYRALGPTTGNAPPAAANPPVANSYWTPYRTITEAPGAGGGNTSMILLDNMTMEGNGHLTTGTLVELQNATTFLGKNVKLANTGGRGFEMFGATERLDFNNFETDNIRMPFLAVGDVNEWGTTGSFRLMNSGRSLDWCYNVNCVNGVFPVAGTASNPATLYPEYHHAMTIVGGVNISLGSNGSIKGETLLGGIGVDITGSLEVSHSYLEGFGSNIFTNAFEAGIKEYSHTTAATAAGATVIPVDDAAGLNGWFEVYLTDPTDAQVYAESGQSHSAVQNYQEIPPDYNPANTTTLSSICAGITGCNIYQSTVDNVLIGAAASDGNVYLSKGQSLAHAWPAGALLARINNPGGLDVLHMDHINVVNPPSTGYVVYGGDGKLKPAGWKSTPCATIGDALIGYCYDGLLNTAPSGSTQYVVMDDDDMGVNPVNAAVLWNTTTAFSNGAIVMYSVQSGGDGNFYQAIAANAAGSVPGVNGTANSGWSLFNNEQVGASWIKCLKDCNIVMQGGYGLMGVDSSLARLVVPGTFDIVATGYGGGTSTMRVQDLTRSWIVDNIDNVIGGLHPYGFHGVAAMLGSAGLNGYFISDMQNNCQLGVVGVIGGYSGMNFDCNGNGWLQIQQNGITDLGGPYVTLSGVLTVNGNTALQSTTMTSGTATGVLKSPAITLATATQVACSSNTAGQLSYVQGNATTKDTVQICAHDATNAYAWRTIY